MAPAISVGLGAIGLRHDPRPRRLGLFPGVDGAPSDRPAAAAPGAPAPPTFRRPAYLVYPTNPVDPDLLEMALDGLRAAAAGETR